MKKKVVVAALPFWLAMGIVWAQGADQPQPQFTYPPLRDMTGRIVSDRFGHAQQHEQQQQKEMKRERKREQMQRREAARHEHDRGARQHDGQPQFTYPPLRDMTGRIVSDRFGHERRGAAQHPQRHGA
ncbi:MAG: hypothetical protein N2690_12025, partial [Rhodocyclaceae bacterium]|nr:hypothetical protein [Rhodocyclaceae bacterium]